MTNQYRSVLASSGSAPTGGTAIASEVLTGKTFTNDNGLQTGTMANNGAVSQSLSIGESYTIPEGFHNGNGIVTTSAPDFDNLIIVDNSGTYPNGTATFSDLTVNKKYLYVAIYGHGTAISPTFSGATVIDDGSDNTSTGGCYTALITADQTSVTVTGIYADSSARSSVLIPV